MQARQPLLETFEAWADTPERAPATLGDLLDELGAGAFGASLFVLALPCAPPFLYVLPQIVAVPMLLLALQLALGRRVPWLPGKLRERTLDAQALGRAVRRARPLIHVLERITAPRLSALTARGLHRLLGVFLSLFALSVLVPLPSTNTVPGIAIAVTAFGLAERDGILVVLGLVLGSLWIAALLIAASFTLNWML